MPCNEKISSRRHGPLVEVCLQNAKVSDAAFTNMDILGYSTTKFVVFGATGSYHGPAAAVTTSVGMDILGHSAKLTKLPRMNFFPENVVWRMHTFAPHETQHIMHFRAQN